MAVDRIIGVKAKYRILGNYKSVDIESIFFGVKLFGRLGPKRRKDFSSIPLFQIDCNMYIAKNNANVFHWFFNIKLLILYGQSSEDLVVDVEENENIKKLIILNKNLS